MKYIASVIPDDKPLWQLTVGEFRSLVANPAAKADDELLTAEQIEAEFKVGLGTLKAAASRDEITLLHGGMRRIMARRADVVAWIESRPVKPPSPRKSRKLTGENIDPLDQMLAAGELIARRGAR